MSDKKKPTVFHGWFLLSATFIITTIAYSMRNSFPIFYDDILDEFGWTRASTAFAFSLGLLVYGIASPLVGSLVDRLGPRIVLVFASCILSAGLLALSRMSALWLLYLSFGVVLAIGVNSMGYATQFAYLPNWFVRRRGLAVGVVSAAGALVLPSVAFISTSYQPWGGEEHIWCSQLFPSLLSYLWLFF